MINIKWLTDEHDCDSCGYTSAEGAIVTIDGVEIFELEPVAYCFGSAEYSSETVYKMIIAHLGHEVRETF